ncbi:hypothetical protein ACROAE_12370 [Shewanella sp. MF05960]|uniref:hypothetical protein n=1 Tax=Shewanella sp. MF05960 TaxID=3434874 RepID=UPI003D7A6E9A
MSTILMSQTLVVSLSIHLYPYNYSAWHVCMWHDMGNEVTVESDSLPRFLIEGKYF